MIHIEKQEGVMALPGAFAVHNGRVENLYNTIGFPERLRTRLELQKLHYTEMPTAIVLPGERFELHDLWSVAFVMGEHNRKVGLPDDIHDMVIRTRHMTPARGNGKSGEYNPMLQISNIWSDSPTMLTMGEEKRWWKVESFELWRATLEPDMIMLLHEEHPAIQRKCIHGQILRKKDELGWEIIAGRGYEHAREIGSPKGIFCRGQGLDPNKIVFNMIHERNLGSLLYNNVWDAVRLGTELEPHIERLERIVLEYNARVGNLGTYDFRIFTPATGYAVDAQVFDGDFTFGTRGIANVYGEMRSTGIADIDMMAEQRLGRD